MVMSISVARIVQWRSSNFIYRFFRTSLLFQHQERRVLSFSSASVAGSIKSATRVRGPNFNNTAKRFASTANDGRSAVVFNVQDEDDFKQRVLESDIPVIVDFYADWCGPCKIIMPRLEKIVASHSGKVLMAKVNIDQNTDLAIEHGVEAVPTVLAVKRGKVLDKFIGVKDEDQVETFVGKLLI